MFHPLCGADPATLAALLWRHGLPAPHGATAFAVAGATSLVRLPFTLVERALDLLPDRPHVPPVFIVGHPRSGTTHLHNLMAASGAFATVPPVRAAMPWESRTLGPLLKPFIDPFLPATRLIDSVAMAPDAPTEDEVGLANGGPLSYFQALYFPRNFARDYPAALLGHGTPRLRAARERAVRRYVAAMARRTTRPLLLKNPAYTAEVPLLLRRFPDARVIHIRREPHAVFASSRRALTRALGELALQRWDHVNLDAVILATYPRLMAALRDGTAGLPSDRFAEVGFEDLVASPEAVLARLWERLALPGATAAMTRIASYRATIADYRPEGSGLDPVEVSTVERHWGAEVRRYGRLSAAGDG